MLKILKTLLELPLAVQITLIICGTVLILFILLKNPTLVGKLIRKWHGLNTDDEMVKFGLDMATDGKYAKNENQVKQTLKIWKKT